jgi:nucleotide-binding universal stress UspA family protein
MDPSIRSIVYPTDFSDLSFAAFVHALRIAVAAKSKLNVLHVEQEGTHETSGFPRVQRLLLQWGLLEENDPPSAITTKLGIDLEVITLDSQNPANGIVHFLRQHRCDLVVLATHGRDGLDHWLKGSIAETVFSQSAISTLFVPRGARGFVDQVSGELRLRRVLVPVHHSPVPYRAIEAARSLPHLLTGSNIDMHVLHVVGIGPAFHDAKIPIVFRPGNVVRTILDTAVEYDVDFICMPTAGHHGILDNMRGSTTERVLRHAPCPLLAIPAV